MATYRQIDISYKSAIKNKGKNPAFVEYDLHRCSNHNRIVRSLKDHSLKSRAFAYIVHFPVIREVFSAFMDLCIVAHWLVSYIRVKMEAYMTPRVFNNRVKKGLDRALVQLRDDIREVSNEYTEDCFVYVCDSSGYFPNANQKHSYKMLEMLLLKSDEAKRDLDELMYALKLLIFFDKNGIIRKSPISDWSLLKAGKSVLEKPEGIGALPGEMIMQIAMTCYCDPVHKWIESLGIRFVAYGDDIAFVINGSDKWDFLHNILPEYRRRMAEIGCAVHKKKFYAQHFTKGVKFCSQVVKVDRIYVGNRTKNNYSVKIRKWNRRVSVCNIEHIISSLNSYIGLMKNRNAYGILRKGYEKLSDKWKKFVFLDEGANTLKARIGYGHNDLLKLKYSLI